ncbi:MAG: lysophospholipid acyltransferase family protein [Vicinamibacterales bacterium]
MGLSASQRLKATLIAGISYPLIALLCRTYRWRVDGEARYNEVTASGRQPILALWHGRILAGLHHFKNRGVVVMTSRNFDGEWIARILHKFGFGTARGSTSRGGARALVQMRRDLRAGRPAAFTVDGPRGPARVVQPGVVFLAGSTGHPILPYHIESDRHWTLGSWDRTQIPKPFAHVALAIGEPLDVPGTEDDVVESFRVRVDEALRALERRAKEMLDEQ